MSISRNLLGISRRMRNHARWAGTRKIFELGGALGTPPCTRSALFSAGGLLSIPETSSLPPADLTPRVVPPSKLDPGPFEVHSREQSQGMGSRAASHDFLLSGRPYIADTVTGHPICQE